MDMKPFVGEVKLKNFVVLVGGGRFEIAISVCSHLLQQGAHMVLAVVDKDGYSGSELAEFKRAVNESVDVDQARKFWVKTCDLGDVESIEELRKTFFERSSSDEAARLDGIISIEVYLEYPSPSLYLQVSNTDSIEAGQTFLEVMGRALSPKVAICFMGAALVNAGR